MKLIDLIDGFGELSGWFPWLYRGWLFVLSGKYRKKVSREWRMKGTAIKIMDIAFSIVFMVTETALVVLLVTAL